MSRILLLVICACFFMCTPKEEKSSTDKPNIVFILADDCTHWDIGAYGSKDAKTPNIDQLAADGIQLKDGKEPSTGEPITTWEVKR